MADGVATGAGISGVTEADVFIPEINTGRFHR